MLCPSSINLASEGELDERSTVAGRNAEGSVYPYIGWKAQEAGGQRPSLCGLGDLPHERFSHRPEPDLRVADQRLVWSGHPALRRRRQELAPAGDAARRADHN